MTRRTRPTVARRSTLESAAVGAIEQLERRQLLAATIGVNTGLMVYNAVNGANSTAETLTISNYGDAPLTLGPTAFALSGSSATRFTLVNAASAPATLAVGATFGLQLTYKPNLVGRQVAGLTISTNDPVNPNLYISQSGIGTNGTYGSNQPSLARILRAYGIPTIVGEGANDANEATDSVYPTPPDVSSQEVTMQRLQKAGAGPVTIQVLASFDAAAAEPYTLGYYTAGNPNAKSELFYTPSTESQSTYIQPVGSTTFDPGGTAFGMYFVSNIKDNGSNRIGYSEDALNTFDTTVPRKFRFFPLENSDGTTVANAYVMTSTEYNAPAGYDFTNLVAIIRNVTPAEVATAPALTITNPSALPGSTTIPFTYIRSQNTTLGDVFHNTNTLTLTNTGGSALTIASISSSNSNFAVTSPTAFPVSVAAGSSTTLTVKYTEISTPTNSYNTTDSAMYPSGGGYELGTLTINSNDPIMPSRVLNLTGYTQYHSENENEPGLQTIVNTLLGYGTLINPTPTPVLTETLSANGSPTYYGEETVSAYWQAADPSRAVSVIQIAAYHTEGDSDTFGYYKQGSTSVTTVVNQAADDGQTIFPLNSSGTLATGNFTTSSTFGFKVSGSAGNIWSDDTKNSQATAGGHDFRFYQIRDASGNAVANTYLVTMDYPSSTQNFDFQDNAWIVTNINPASGTGQAPAAPTDVAASYTGSGVQITWAPSLTTGVVGYNVFRQNSDGSFTKLTASALVASTSYLDTTASSSTAYTYAVNAATAGGAMTSQRTMVTTTLAVPPPVPASATISGTVFDDSNGNGTLDAGEVGVANFAVYIDVQHNGVYDAGIDPISYTNAGGQWSIPGLNPGTYTVIQTPPGGWNRTLPGGNSYSVTVGSNQTVGSKNFGADQLGNVTGNIFYDVNGTGTLAAGDPGLAGWTVYIDNNRNGQFDQGTDTRFTADANGNFAVNGLAPGKYYFGQEPVAGWARSTPATLPIIVTVTERGTTVVNFGETRAALSGTVFSDANADGTQDGGEAGLSGVTVFLDFYGTGVYQNGDVAVTTDSSGNYTINGLAPGTYTVVATTPSGTTKSTPTTAGYTATVTAGQRVTGDNFGFIPTASPTSQVAGPFAA